MKKIILFIITAVFISAALYADTVILKNRTKVKGLVVDEYVDRIALSTVEGERHILRKDIDRIEYDTPEQNFMQLGRAYDSKGWYDKAAFYYKKAIDINPDYKEARDAYVASHAKMWHEEEKRTKKDIDLHNMAKEWQARKNKQVPVVVKSKEIQVKESLGISVTEHEGIFRINEVVPGSSSAKAGIQKGDFLVGIWGRLIRYSKLEDILGELIGPKYSEVKILVSRDISIPAETGANTYKDLGASLGFEYEGLLIKDIIPGKKAESSGLKKGDLVIAIDKNVTRYLPLDSVISLISNPKNDKIVFTVRRSINLRREGE
ncbi:MAG: PDZ domain-containing protein [Candidatus Omnitrophica bacterium]|nr:PDZ domain-containing protein [Candidatus Omnitrophota bacterium]